MAVISSDGGLSSMGLSVSQSLLLNGVSLWWCGMWRQRFFSRYFLPMLIGFFDDLSMLLSRLQSVGFDTCGSLELWMYISE